MNGQEQLNEAMAEFNRGQMALEREMRRFAELNSAIQGLQSRAGSDPEAREKLRGLDEMMREGGLQMKERFEQSAMRLESNARKWVEEIKSIAPPQDQLPKPAGAEVLRVASKKRNRSFF